MTDPVHSPFIHKEQHQKIKSIEILKAVIDSESGRKLYGKRMGTVEPVFGNLRANKGLDRFTLPRQEKVSTQWNLYCLVRNIEKLAHRGYGAR